LKCPPECAHFALAGEVAFYEPRSEPRNDAPARACSRTAKGSGQAVTLSMQLRHPDGARSTTMLATVALAVTQYGHVGAFPGSTQTRTAFHPRRVGRGKSERPRDNPLTLDPPANCRDLVPETEIFKRFIVRLGKLVGQGSRALTLLRGTS
jgi:hypothetical protein